MKIVVTAGPTREMIDDVRYLSNLSSGRTGLAVAEACVRAGHEVVLVCGPIERPVPDGPRVVRVVSALDMQAAVDAEWESLDALIMTAAVADYRPARRHAGKLKKTDDVLALELIRNPDILALAGARKGRRVLIGFALEADDALRHGRDKLRRKNLDLLVLNGPENLGAARSRFRLLAPDREEPPRDLDKAELGDLLAARCAALAR